MVRGASPKAQEAGAMSDAETKPYEPPIGTTRELALGQISRFYASALPQG